MRFVSFRWLRSLVARLLCTYVAALMLTMCFMACALWFSFSQDVGVTTQVQLRRAASLLHRSLRFDSAGLPVAVVLPRDLSWVSWVFHDFPADLKYRVLDVTGGTIISSENGAAALAPPAKPFDSTLGSFALVSGGETLHVRMERVVHGAKTYYIQVAISERFAAFVRSLIAKLLVNDAVRFALASVVLFTVAVYFTLRRVLMPLRDTSAAAARIDAHNISKRLSTRKLPIEFLPVVEAFNLTLDRLERGYIVQRAFLAGAAHELKTPLALIRAQIDLEGTANREVLLHDLDFMARQVNQLLHLAEASETQNYIFEVVDVAAVAEDVAEYLRRLAELREVYVDIRCPPGIPGLHADRGALFMLLKNILENGIQHSPIGGVVAVTIDSDHLCIRDEGPGIAAGELPKLFTRFWRGASRRNDGAGLGLSICKEIAAAHRWELAARSTGHGAEFILSFRVNTATHFTERVFAADTAADPEGRSGMVAPVP
jgi:two-component system, OmpR family, sensor histidine kinase QseC